jgi:putative SOS response-associated peptidase YedK
MCNEYEFKTNWEEYEEMMASIDLGHVGPPQALPQIPSIKIGDTAPVMRAAGNGVELASMKFGFPPPRPKVAPVFNFKSEGRSFANSNRCLIPATGFFEFTGTKYPKTKHRFWRPGQPWFAIAGLWRETAAGDAFTMLTTQPGTDVAPIHDRQIVVLDPSQWGAWLALSRPEAELLRPSPAGSLATDIVRVGAA